jgi:hypothetical protein
MEEIVFMQSRSDYFSGIALAAGLSGVGVAFIAFARNPALRAGGVIVAVGFSYFLLRKIFDGVPKAPEAVITAYGLSIAEVAVPWDAIARYWFQAAGAIPMMCLELKSPEKFLPPQRPMLKSFNQTFKFGHIQFVIARSGCTPAQIRAFIGERAKNFPPLR